MTRKGNMLTSFWYDSLDYEQQTDEFTYDAAGRMLTHVHTSEPTQESLIVIPNYFDEQYIYDSMGNLVTYNRDADINIFQYDYNTVFTESYRRIMENADYAAVYKDELYLSVSSMSVVTAGFVAMLQEIDDTLSAAEYREILIQTSRPLEYNGERAEHVADISAAVRYLAGRCLPHSG